MQNDIIIHTIFIVVDRKLSVFKSNDVSQLCVECLFTCVIRSLGATFDAKAIKHIGHSSSISLQLDIDPLSSFEVFIINVC